MWERYWVVTGVRRGILYRRGFRTFSRHTADHNESGRFSGYSFVIVMNSYVALSVSGYLPFVSKF